MHTHTYTAAVYGLECTKIRVEVDIANGWPGVTIVGLPDTAIKESKERIRAAWVNSGLTFPHNKRITVNLSPANVKKIGSAFDLPIFGAMLLTIFESNIDDIMLIGELSLDGRVHHVPGTLPTAAFAKDLGFKKIVIPKSDIEEAEIIDGIEIYPIEHVSELISIITEPEKIKPHIYVKKKTKKVKTNLTNLSDIQGHEFPKRALEIAAAGGHNIILNGPPGSGKTLLAKSFPTILPPLNTQESIEVTKIYSVSSHSERSLGLITQRPFRAPHHSASSASLIGGGSIPRPGEVSLAHRGVLFFDEFPEFPRTVIEMLRQPLEDREVTITRTNGRVTYPASFTFVASLNPCPCGFATDEEKKCSCTPYEIARYSKKISGPILDRIDLHIEVPRLPIEKLQKKERSECSQQVQKRVVAARKLQSERLKHLEIHTNSEMGSRELKKFCEISPESEQFLKQAATKFNLSARSYFRILKVARTIADLATSKDILAEHVAEAIQYRIRYRT